MQKESNKWAENQLTKEQAIKMFDSYLWKEWNDEQIVRFQLFQKKLCMPFSCFHSAVENVFGRQVYTHEFAYPDNLKEEYLGSKPEPTLDEIFAILPKDKLLFINADNLK